MQFDESKDQKSNHDVMSTSGGKEDSFILTSNGLKPGMSIESNNDDLFRFTNVVR